MIIDGRFSLFWPSVRRRSIKTEHIAQWLIANKDLPTFLLLFYWSTDIFNIHKKPQQLKRIRFWHAILLKGISRFKILGYVYLYAN